MSSVLAWGDAEYGQLGLGGLGDPFITEPTKVTALEGKNVVSVSVGNNHVLFMHCDGSVSSCGNNSHGQLGQDVAERKPESVPLSVGASAVSAGGDYSLVITQPGDIFTWGYNCDGQLGQGSADTDPHLIPRLLKTIASKMVIQVCTGDSHSMALTNESEIYSWGSNKHGQLGHGKTVTMATSPQLLVSVSSLPVRQIVAGGNHSFLLTRSGALFGWGRNSFGQLGLNDTEDRYYPVLCKPVRSQWVKYVACGEDHTAVLTQNGGVFTFGCGQYGQLGHSSFNNEVLPRRVLELMGSTVTQIACGRHHTLAYLESRGRIYSFGLASHGQLGCGSTKTSHNPVVVKGSYMAHGSQHEPMMTDEDVYVVKSIHSGGDLSYCVVSCDNTVKPLDFREVEKDSQVFQLTKLVAVQIHSLNTDERLPTDLADDIELIFGSLGCLNASFLTSDDAHFCCGKNNSGVNMDLALQCFNLLEESRNLAAKCLLSSTVEEKLIPGLVKCTPPDVEALRIFLTLPLSHLFNDNKFDASIICPYALAVMNLNEAATTLLGMWWTAMKPSYINHLVTIYKNSVVHNLQTSMPSIHSHADILVLKQRVYQCMELLKKLNQVNEQANYIIPYNKFHMDEITSIIDIRSDYLAWLKSSATTSAISFCDYPFVFNGLAKSLLLQTDALIQMQMAVDMATQHNFSSLFFPVDPTNPCLMLCVSRENIVQDTLGQLMKQNNADLKKPLKIIFRNEEAMDAGGVKKEFFMLLIREILNPQYGMFTYDQESRLLWFAQQTFEDMAMFNLIGVICGLAIYNSTIIDLTFPLALFKKCLSRAVTLDDLKELMPSVGRSLQSLLDYEDEDLEQVFDLTFAVTEESFGEVCSVDLTDNGSQLTVTRDNKTQYVQLYVDYVFMTSVKEKFEAFNQGFQKVCGSRVLELFQPAELQAMVIGNEEYDWILFENNAEYKDQFHKNHPTIKIFWIVFHELTLELKKKFLMFLTGSDRIPILGMKAVPIIIQPARGGDNYYPVAHTCFNLLDMPIYGDIDKLREKLLMSIEHTQGFTLV